MEVEIGEQALIGLRQLQAVRGPGILEIQVEDQMVVEALVVVVPVEVV